MRPLALERFEAALAVMAAERKGESVPVRNDPPIIHISTVPALLILIDGEPAYRDVKGTSLTRVLNTRPLILKDATKHYLKIFDGWMEAPALTGPWTVAATVPADCERALRTAADEKIVDMLIGGNPDDPQDGALPQENKPLIYVDTKPAELLVLEGDPKFVPVAGHQADVRREHHRQSLRSRRGPARLYPGVGPLVPRPVGAQGPVGVRGQATQLPKDFSHHTGRERQGEREGIDSPAPNKPRKR